MENLGFGSAVVGYQNVAPPRARTNTVGRRLVRSLATDFDRQTFEQQRNLSRPDGVVELLIEDNVLVG